MAICPETTGHSCQLSPTGAVALRAALPGHTTTPRKCWNLSFQEARLHFGLSWLHVTRGSLFFPHPMAWAPNHKCWVFHPLRNLCLEFRMKGNLEKKTPNTHIDNAGKRVVLLSVFYVFFVSPSSFCWDPKAPNCFNPKAPRKIPSHQKWGARTGSASVNGGAGAGSWASTTTTSCDFFMWNRLKFPYSCHIPKWLERGFSEVWRYYEKNSCLKSGALFCWFALDLPVLWQKTVVWNSHGPLQWERESRFFENETCFYTQEFNNHQKIHPPVCDCRFKKNNELFYAKLLMDKIPCSRKTWTYCWWKKSCTTWDV